MNVTPIPAPATILLVDDDEFIVDIYGIKFSEHGHTVVPCLNADDALQKLRNGFKPDVIVSDLIMPFVDGFDFLKALRAEHLADVVPVVVLSNQDDFVDFEKTKQYGVAAHFVKIHSTPAEVVALVEGVIHHVRDPKMYPTVPVQ